MALTKTEHERRQQKRHDEENKLFDVTCIVGTVYRDALSDKSAHATAMEMIGRNEGQGTFTYPGENGGIVTIEVSFPTREEVEAEQNALHESN